MIKLKFYTIIVVVLACALLSGCSVPGSAGAPVVDESVTISGRIYAPAIAESTLLAAVGQNSNAGSYVRFVASSTLKVNGKAVEFSLNEATRELRVEKIAPASAYELELRCGGFSLIAFAPGSSRQITLPFGLSLRSTAEWYVRAAFGGSQNFAIEHLTDYQVMPAFVDTLAGSLQTELNKSGLASAAWRLAASNSAAALVNGRSLNEVMQRTGRAVSYNGEYVSRVFYYRLNSSGVPVMAVQADVVMTCSTSGDTVTGSFSIEPIAVKPIDNYPVTALPAKTAFAFTGKVSAANLSFTRKAASDGSPLANKDLDSWFIFPVSTGLAVQAQNLDKSYYTGVQTRAGEFILRKK